MEGEINMLCKYLLQNSFSTQKLLMLFHWLILLLLLYLKSLVAMWRGVFFFYIIRKQ